MALSAFDEKARHPTNDQLRTVLRRAYRPWIELLRGIDARRSSDSANDRAIGEVRPSSKLDGRALVSAPLLSEPSGARTPFRRKLDSLANGLNQTTFIGSSRSRYIERSAVIN